MLRVEDGLLLRGTDDYFVLEYLCPLSLLAAWYCRINLLSYAYGVLFIAWTFLPLLREFSSVRRRKHLLYATMSVCTFNILAQFCFHLSLLGNAAANYPIVNCSYAGLVIKQLGFIRMTTIPPGFVVRELAPEFFISVIVFYVYIKLRAAVATADNICASKALVESIASAPIHGVGASYYENFADFEGEHFYDMSNLKLLEPSKFQKYKQEIRRVVFFVLLALAGCLRPSLASAVYFATLLIIATACAANLQPHPRNYWLFSIGATVYTAVHLNLMYFYQFEFFHRTLTVSEIHARILGLVLFVKPECADNRTTFSSGNYRWFDIVEVFVLPAIMIALRFEMAHYVPPQKRRRMKALLWLRVMQERLTRRVLSIIRPGVSVSTHYKCNQLLYQEHNGYLKEIAEDIGQIKSPNEERSSRKRREPDDMIKTVCNTALEYSYFITLIMMMAWSVFYHSWSTFVLLMLSCVMWMVPNPRAFCLNISPFLVVYAEILLCFQFVYGLDLREDELEPRYMLKQLGLEPPHEAVPCKPLLMKLFFTLSFCLSFRQRMRDAQRNTTVNKLLASQFDARFHAAIIPDRTLKLFTAEKKIDYAELGRRFARFCHEILTTYWIFISSGILLFIALRPPVSAYRIIYMALFLIFAVSFQISVKLWTAILHPFYLAMIAYCITVLALIYTYQFHGFPEIWRNGTGWSDDVLVSLGLEQYSSGELFLKLCSPLSFLLVALFQLNFFHKQLLNNIRNVLQVIKRAPELNKDNKALQSMQHVYQLVGGRSKMSSTSSSLKATSETTDTCGTCTKVSTETAPFSPSSGEEGNENAAETAEIPTKIKLRKKRLSFIPKVKNIKKLRESVSAKAAQSLKTIHWSEALQQRWKNFSSDKEHIAAVAWRILEVHLPKFIAFWIILTCVKEVSAIHIPLVVVVAIMVPQPYLGTFLCGTTSIWSAAIIIAKMVYQMRFVKEDQFAVNCSLEHGRSFSMESVIDSTTSYAMISGTRWAGLLKSASLPSHIMTHLVLQMLLILRMITHVRQRFYRSLKGIPLPPPGIVFPSVTREDADRSLAQTIRYAVNYGFYKYGIEICLMSIVATIGVRQDGVALVYCVWFVTLLCMSRKQMAKIWRYYVFFLSIVLPLQYALCVGLAPTFCASYPWFKMDENLVEWMYLPDYTTQPNPIKLICDFFQLLFASCQMYVFEIEESSFAHYYPGGQNDEEAKLVNPITRDERDPKMFDFISTKKSYLDLVKVVVFVYTYWLTLCLTFLAGVGRVTLFALGYVLASFVFLWRGNELFLSPLAVILQMWRWLMGYNVTLIILKTALQLVGCVYLKQLYRNYCWILQLFGIACLMRTGKDPQHMVDSSIMAECSVPTEEAGIFWDGICFGLLLLQRRIFHSPYFTIVVEEYRAQQALASRGAELINQLMDKRLRAEDEAEAEIVQKIKTKMERIRTSHIQSPEAGERMSSMSGVNSDGQSSASDDMDNENLKRIDSTSTVESQRGSQDTVASRALRRAPSIENRSESKLSTLPIVRRVSSHIPKRITDDRRERPRSMEMPMTHEQQMALSPPDDLPLSDVRTKYKDPWATMDDMPTEDEDRRKGLGPLQLLNAAFRRGDIKEAVKTAREVEREEKQLERELKRSVGVVDRKLVKQQLRHRQSFLAKPQADFDEETFDEDHLSPGLSGPEHKIDISPTKHQKRISFQTIREASTDSDHSAKPEVNLFSPDRTSVTQTAQDESEDDTLDKKDSPDEEKTTDVVQNIPILRAIAEKLSNAKAFLSLFLKGVLESLIAWLLKISRDYRYVSFVLGKEKKRQKEEMRKKYRRLWRPVNRKRPETRVSCFHAFELNPVYVEENLSKTAMRKISVPKDETTATLEFTDIEAKNFSRNQHVLIRLFLAAYYVLISRSELFCYFVMVLNHMSSASLLSMTYPMLAFLWGALSVPRPSKRFWVVMITYTQITVIVKFLFQFGFFPWNKVVPPGSNSPFWAPRIIGVEKDVYYAGYDMALLMILFFHRSVLKSLGLWQSDDRSNPMLKSLVIQNVFADDIFPKRHSVPEITLKQTLHKERLAFLQKMYLDEGKHRRAFKTPNSTLFVIGPRLFIKKILSFFGHLLVPKKSCSADLYAPMFLCDFTCFLIIVFGYKGFGTDTGGDVASYFEENKIPGPFLAMLIVQFVLIVVERALFLRKCLLGKIIFQLALVIFVHIWVFLILPSITERRFVDNLPAKLWYFVKCLYFCLSAWQIRAGYPTRILGNMLTKKHNLISMVLFKSFMNVPFLFELRSLMDWIWTDTSMGLFDWLKLEDIYANVYEIKCTRKFEEDYPSPRGAKKSRLVKYLGGGCALFTLIFIIWFPLLIFALGNTVGIRRLPHTFKLTVGIDGYEPLFTVMSQQERVRPLTQEEFGDIESWFKNERVAINYMADYGAEDVIRVILDGDSNTQWMITPPARKQLLRDLTSPHATMKLTAKWSFLRDTDGPLVPSELISERSVELTEDARRNFTTAIKRKEDATIYIRDLLPPYLKIPSKGFAEFPLAFIPESLAFASPEEQHSIFIDVKLELKASRRIDAMLSAAMEWWRIHPDVVDTGDEPARDYMTIVAFADKVFPATFNMITGGGIVSLYVSIVFLASRFVRMLVTGGMYRIMYEELPNADRILQLCHDIFLVREAGELELEEDLYAKLIFLYRSPATLIKWTRKKEY